MEMTRALSGGTLHEGQGIWIGMFLKKNDTETYETVLMNISQASTLASNLLDAITRAHKERGGVPAEE